jgi:alpha-tubulin suppressor-like RCC1 family protein
MGVSTGYINSSGLDIGIPLVPKSYLIDRYPELADTFKQAGLWLWGSGQSGALGDNTIVNKSSPVQTIAGGTNWKQVSADNRFSGGIKTDGTLWLWGQNNYGPLGNNTRTNVSSPIQTIAGGTNWKQVSCGYVNTASIKTDGTLWIWGENNSGQLGDNTRVSKSSPVQTISGGANWKYVASGYQAIAAIKTDGTLWVWGNGFNGSLGNNSTTDVSSPIQTVAGGTNWKQVSCGNSVKAAIKTDGTLWLWGQNNYGQLGNNTRTNVSSPIQTISGGTNWTQLSVSFFHTTSIKTDGTLWLWGYAAYGELGDNTRANKSSPVQTVSGGTNWKLVSTGLYTTSSIKTDGTLWLWGRNNYGQLGINSSDNRSSPVQTVAGGTNWKQLAINGGGSNLASIQDNSADIFGNPL